MCNYNNLNGSKTIYGQATNSTSALFENLISSWAIGLRVGIFMGTTGIITSPFIAGFLIVGGIFLLTDSHGLITGTASAEDTISFVIDL